MKLCRGEVAELIILIQYLEPKCQVEILSKSSQPTQNLSRPLNLFYLFSFRYRKCCCGVPTTINYKYYTTLHYTTINYKYYKYEDDNDDNKTKRHKDKRTKRQKDKRTKDKKTKRQKDKKTKRQKDNKTKD